MITDSFKLIMMGTFLYRSGKVFAAIFLVLIIPFSDSVKFQLSRFTPEATIIFLEGDAVYSVGQIELNKVNYLCRVGRVIYNGKVPLWDTHTGKLADFSTHFTFTVDTQGRSPHGNGLAFFLAPVGFQIPPNSAGGFLGLFNTSNADFSQAQIVTVEFDSFANPEWDPPYEHVGINNNSIASAVTAPWNVTLHSGDNGDAWITYNATTRNLIVFWGYGGGPNSNLSYQIDLKNALPQWVTVGISAATGSNVERHTVMSWEFSSSLDIKESPGNSRKKIGLIMGLTLFGCVVVASAVVAYIVWKRKRRHGVKEKDNPDQAKSTSINDDLEEGAGPRRFSYRDLVLATNNFSNDRKLGEGGFGGVYKGHLIDLDIPVAVKKFSRGSKQGKKEYITEVKVISMLRHRNLVKLIGWCHDQGEFLLVYEFMPNGSLDNHLFGSKNRVLDWAVRYKIALGLASALLYLHEESEQCVIHRDIKASNVMLDQSFNVKLGDFGLARLMDHGLDMATTGLAGTLGYLAPEYVNTGRASTESDVYSFGVVALEIATGRKSASRFEDEPQKGLVGWVWNHYGNGQLLSAVDIRLKMQFEPRQMECLIIVGLWCAHPDSSHRPSIRQASHVLNFEAGLPQLPTRMPVAMYHPPPRSPSISSGEASITASSINIGR